MGGEIPEGRKGLYLVGSDVDVARAVTDHLVEV